MVEWNIPTDGKFHWRIVVVLVVVVVWTGGCYGTRGRGRRLIFKARDQANLPLTVCILHGRKRRSTHIAVRRQIVGGEDTVPLRELRALGVVGRGEVGSPELLKGRRSGSPDGGAGRASRPRSRGGSGRRRGRGGGGGSRRGVVAVVERPLLARVSGRAIMVGGCSRCHQVRGRGMIRGGRRAGHGENIGHCTTRENRRVIGGGGGGGGRTTVVQTTGRGGGATGSRRHDGGREKRATRLDAGRARGTLRVDETLQVEMGDGGGQDDVFVHARFSGEDERRRDADPRHRLCGYSVESGRAENWRPR